MQMIAGVDEVGRGPLAGAVVAAAVILKNPIEGLTDSKLLSAKQREALVVIIQENAIAYAYGRAEPAEIDSLNIHHATLLAMKRAIFGLSVKPEKIIIDGLYAPDCGGIPCSTQVQGDLLIPAISAASILAKVHRDKEMEAMDKLYPGYGFAQHKGYATEVHKLALKKLGPCLIHRKHYAPVKEAAEAFI